ncbi:MAG: chitobiase/beta-hexosaminidase C-terminal domain-containing protein, partial [Fibrobacteria bacterium]|nr:chitobiase/beta-hexosaminidase C-terminal domain-containing protein [Fibrobacteria bacterium]
ETLQFGDNTARRTGGAATGDLNHNGWQDVFVVGRADESSPISLPVLYIHQGIQPLNAFTYSPVSCPPIYGSAESDEAYGATFGDVDNDGDLDMFLCNGGKLYLNKTNLTNAPASHNAPTGDVAEHYLDVKVSRSFIDKSDRAADGVGSRIYLYTYIDNSPASYDSSHMVAMREINGGASFGNQSTQVQHFGLSESLGAEPHTLAYTVKVIFSTSEVEWRYRIIPDSVRTFVPYNNNQDTTILEQTLEITNSSIMDLAEPTALPAAGDFKSQINVTLQSSDEGAVLLYTLDGTDPDITAGGATQIYTGPVSLIKSDTIKARAVKMGWPYSEVLTAVYTKIEIPSRLEILDENGNPFSGDILTSDQSQFTIKLSTNQAGVSVYEPLVVSSVLQDQESLALSTNTGDEGNYDSVYQNLFPLHIAGAVSGNDTVETADFDALVVQWINPVNSNDIAADTLIIQPADIVAEVYFSTSDSLKDTVSQFNGEGEIYILIKDQLPDTRFSSVVVLQAGLDSEKVVLEWDKGILIGHLHAAYSNITRGDGTLQPKLSGDDIVATYIDRLYGEQAQSSVSFAAKPISSPAVNVSDGSWFAGDTGIVFSSAGDAIIRYREGTGAPLEHPDSGLVYNNGDTLYISATTTLRAIAYYRNSDNNYLVSSERIVTYNRRPQVANPSAEPDSVFFTDTITVTLDPADGQDTVYYRINGGSYQLYSSAVLVSASSLFDFYAVNAPGLPSDTVSKTFTRRDTLAMPIATPGDTVFLDSVVVSLVAVDGSVIRYTLDGNTPTETSTLYDSMFVFTEPAELKARSFPVGDAYIASKDVMSHVYTPILTVSFTPGSTSFISSLSASLFANTDSADIFYTVDGTNPVTSETGSTRLYTDIPVPIVNTTTVKAIAVKSLWRNSDNTEAVYTRQSTPSRLVILDASGDSIPDGILTGEPSAYTLRVSTNYMGSDSLHSSVLSLNLGDDENLLLDTMLSASGGYASVFENLFLMNLSGSAASNGTLEYSYYDTLVAVWGNPFDVLDTVRDTVILQPDNYVASVHFSLADSGSLIHAFSRSQDTVFLVVRDQQSDSDRMYEILITTEQLDSQRVSLSVRDDSTLTGWVLVNYDTVQPGDDTLQINLQGEQVNVQYYDSLYGEQALNYALFQSDTVMAPTFTSDSGTSFADTTRVVLNTSTAWAKIRFYAAAGVDSVPSHLLGTLFESGDTIIIDTTLVLRAVAYKENDVLENYLESEKLIVNFTKNGDVAVPVATPPGGYFTDSIQVLLSTETDSANIFYTLDGTDPRSSGTVIPYDSTVGITITTDSVELKFYGKKTSHTSTPMITESYLRRDTLGVPVATPGDTTYRDSVQVTLTPPVVNGAIIRYTLDGNMPTEASQLYLGALTFTGPVILKARTFPDSEAYVAGDRVISHVYTPTLVINVAPDSGTVFTYQQTVTLSTNSAGASIYYTLDGSSPDTIAGSSVFQYSKAFSIADTTTVKAIAVNTDWQMSDTLTSVYYRGHTQSTIAVTDSNGSVFTDNRLQTIEAKFAIKLSTNYGGSDTLLPLVRCAGTGDSERVALYTIVDSDTSHARIYWESPGYALAVSTVAKGNGSVEVNSFDTLIFEWVNPLDSADRVVDTVYIEPADQKAIVSFTDTLNGSVVTGIAEGATIYIAVEDQTPHPDLTYSVRLETPTGDVQVVYLSPVGGRLTGSVPASYGPIVSGDDTLQINLGGEQLRVYYTDPYFTSDKADGAAAYAAKTLLPPTAQPAANAWFMNDTLVSLIADTAAVFIRWTLGGSVPGCENGILSTDSVPVLRASVVLKAVACLQHNAGNAVVSAVLSSRYNRRDTTVVPSASPHSGYFTDSLRVSLSVPDVQASLYYTLDGSLPDTTANLYSGPILITDTTRLQFIAHAPSDVPSTVVNEVYIPRDSLTTPVAVPGDTSFQGMINVRLQHEKTNITIRYTTDGTQPNDSSAVYNAAVPLQFIEPTILTIRTFNAPGKTNFISSGSVSYRYVPIVSAPVADPVSGTSFVSSLVSRLSSASYRASIYYTLGGAVPDTNSLLYTGSLLFSATDTLKALAVKDGWMQSDVVTIVYTKSFTGSELKLFNASFQEPEYLSEQNGSFIIQVKAAEAALTTVHPVASTLVNGDVDTLMLNRSGRDGDFYLFSSEVSFLLGDADVKIGDGHVQAAYFDTLVVSWQNPKDTNDVVMDTVVVRPKPQQSLVYFGDRLGENAKVRHYETEVDTIYIVVEDQKAWSREVYRISVTTRTLYNERTPDTLSIELAELKPGLFGAAIAVIHDSVPNLSDSHLQVLRGDKIYVTYSDPVDGDEAGAFIDYSTPGEVREQLFFTDSRGEIIADGVFGDIQSDSLYIRYMDDYSTFLKTVTLITENTSGTGAKTFDTLMISFTPAERVDSIGFWYTAVPLKESMIPADNDILELYYNARIIASVTSHYNNGNSGVVVRDTMSVASDYVEAEISLRDKDSDTSLLLRTSENIEIKVEGQDFSSWKDTIQVNVQCNNSMDKIDNVLLVEDENGVYTGTLVKHEGSKNPDDSVLNCLAEDDIKVTYLNPVYTDFSSFQFGWKDKENLTAWFAVADTAPPVEELWQYEYKRFMYIIETVSPNQDAVDTLEVLLNITNGETWKINVVETGKYTGRFESEMINYGFAVVPDSENDVLEALLDTSEAEHVHIVTATVFAGTDTLQSKLMVKASYIAPKQAWIIDGNSDGWVDSIFIRFKSPVLQLPEQISSIDWPADGGNEYTAMREEITYYKTGEDQIDSTLIVVRLDEEQFDSLVTSPLSENPPMLTLPEGGLFAGVSINIEDRLGPVIIAAEKHPSDLEYYTDAEGRSLVNPDTLDVTLSEKINLSYNTILPWDSLVLFYNPNETKLNSKKLVNLLPPIVVDDKDSLVWRFFVTNTKSIFKPDVSDRIYLSRFAPYTDTSPAKNLPQEIEAVVRGEDSKKIISNSSVFIPIEGLNPGTVDGMNALMIFDKNGKVVVHDDIKIITDNNGQKQVFFEWFRPKGLQSDGTINTKIQMCQEGKTQDEESLSRYPSNCLSAIQIFSRDKYIAEINVFDHLGKFIHSSVQRFGYCGELENTKRKTSQGHVNWLVWNQKDVQGEYVGTGVYIWKVIFRSPEDSREIEYRQGIIRSTPPNKGCAAR